MSDPFAAVYDGENIFDIKEQEPLTDFIIKGHDIALLKRKAGQFIEMVGKLFSSSQEKLTLQDIRDAVSHIESRSEVIETWGALQDYNLEGVVYTICRKDGTCCYIAYLNEKIVDLMCDDSNKPIIEKCPRNSACAKNYFRALKSVYLHELCHLLLKRVNSSMPVKIDKSGDSDVILMCDKIHNLYSKARIHDEFDCDLLSFVFAFWPRKKFTKAVMSTLCNWWDSVEGDLRIQVANRFLMPVNATIQWMVILFYDKFGMHYVRREEVQKKNLDFLDYKRNVYCFYNNDVFSVEGTAAWHAANDGLRADYKTRVKTQPFLCNAFYERKEWFCNRAADEIIVVGFNAQRVKEEGDIFMAGAVE